MMEKESFGKEFWENRWKEQSTKWDIGYPSTPLKNYIDSLTDKTIRVLVPGCGNAYEAEYLFRNGFANVFIIDIAEIAIESFRKRVPDFPADHILHADFFTFKPAEKFDLILEQTFYCAINPEMREAYVKKMHEIIKPSGKLVGLLFNDPLLNFEGPPFYGDEKEYRERFKNGFILEKMEPSLNSIGPRIGRELFFVAKRA